MMQGVVEKGFWEGELDAENMKVNPLPVIFSANMVCDENGEPMCTMSSFVDISFRRKMQEDLF
ncbi:MAG: hypothetical protein R2861_10890 [Desulfobacterales bacterium]